MAERGIMPWERGGGFVADMFGFLDEDPAIRRAREENYDRTQAEVKAAARLAAPRVFDTPAAVFDELIAPIDRRYESDAEKERRLQREAMSQRDAFRTVSPGSMVIDPATRQVIANNPTDVKEPVYQIPFTAPSFRSESRKVPMTRRQVLDAKASGSLPQFALESPEVQWITSGSPVSTNAPSKREPFIHIGENIEGRSNPFRRGFESITSEPPKPRRKWTPEKGLQ